MFSAVSMNVVRMTSYLLIYNFAKKYTANGSFKVRHLGHIKVLVIQLCACGITIVFEWYASS